MTALNRVKRNKPLMILLLPLVVCLFAVGWIMYVTGQVRSTAPQKAEQTKQKEDYLTIGAIPFEEKQEIYAN